MISERMSRAKSQTCRKCMKHSLFYRLKMFKIDIKDQEISETRETRTTEAEMGDYRL